MGNRQCNTKIPEVEARIGPLPEYFRTAIKAGKGQREMAIDLGVSKPTVNDWLEKFGFRAKFLYFENGMPVS